MNVLIIEDEVAAARGLTKAIIDIDPTIQVLCVLRTVRESIEWLNCNSHPPLIFMDIKLIDGDSFQILEKVNIQSQVIFCTAYEEYAIRAFKINCLHYILKPIDRDDLQESLERFRQTQSADQQPLNDLVNYLQKESQNNYRKRFLVKAANKYFYVPIEEVDYFYTEEKANFLVTKNQRKHLVDDYLDEIQSLLNPQNFFRINRQFIISIDVIDRIENDYGKHTVSLKGHDILPTVSKHRVKEFRSWLSF